MLVRKKDDVTGTLYAMKVFLVLLVFDLVLKIIIADIKESGFGEKKSTCTYSDRKKNSSTNTLSVSCSLGICLSNS